MTTTVTLRPAGTLGDQSTSTAETATGVAPGTAASGTLLVVATALANVENLGAIVSVKLAVTAGYSDPAVVTSARCIRWVEGGVARTFVPDADFATSPSFNVCQSAALTVDADGNGWTWTRLAAIADLGAQLDYTQMPADPGPVVLTVAEVAVVVTYVPQEAFTIGQGVGEQSANATVGGITLAAAAGEYTAEAVASGYEVTAVVGLRDHGLVAGD